MTTCRRKPRVIESCVKTSLTTMRALGISRAPLRLFFRWMVVVSVTGALRGFGVSLWPVFMSACTSSTDGSESEKELRRLFGYTTMLKARSGAGTIPYTEEFKSGNRSFAAWRRFKRALVVRFGWKMVVMNIEGRRQLFFFVIQLMLRRSK